MTSCIDYTPSSASAIISYVHIPSIGPLARALMTGESSRAEPSRPRSIASHRTAPSRLQSLPAERTGVHHRIRTEQTTRGSLSLQVRVGGRTGANVNVGAAGRGEATRSDWVQMWRDAARRGEASDRETPHWRSKDQQPEGVREPRGKQTPQVANYTL